MKKKIYHEPYLHEGVPGFVSVNVEFVSKDELNSHPLKARFGNSPKSISNLMSDTKVRSIKFTDPISHTEHTIDFDALGVTDWENTYYLIETWFDIGPKVESEPKRTFNYPSN